MTGAEDAPVCVQTERGPLHGAVAVAWIACDANLLFPGDEGVVVDAADEAGWDTSDVRDLCPDCAKKAGLE